jgi:hypothetical protein
LVDLYQVEQVLWEVLEDKVNFALFFEGLPDTDDVVAFEHFEHLNFSLDCPLVVLIFVSLFKFLNGD